MQNKALFIQIGADIFFSVKETPEIRRGFTLLELMVVTIILGILATMAIPQYQLVIEKARGAEARQIIGAIRTNEAGIRMQTGSCTAVNAYTGIGISLDHPGPVELNCRTSNYFYYAITAANANGFTVKATRCTVNGKFPNSFDPPGSRWIELQTDFPTGLDRWTTSGHY